MARGSTGDSLAEKVPAAARDFVVDLLGRYDVVLDPDRAVSRRTPATVPDVGEALMDVAFRHPVRLIANALGIAPPSIVERARAAGVPVTALVGAKEHAIRQVNAGVDILEAQGGEAGGHCAEVSTLVLVPEVIKAIAPIREVPVLAAGGIMTGAQMAGCMAMGAAGAWTGSAWLATTQAETTEAFRQKMVEASSRDTVRSKARTGKPSRQLRSAWRDAWERPDAPAPLPMPYMGLLSAPALSRIDKAAAAGNDKARELVTFVGQGVGLVDRVRSAEDVVAEFMTEFADAAQRLSTWTR